MQVLANGNLILPPFRAEDYNQEAHAQTYRCLAANTFGKIQSRDVHVRAGTAEHIFYPPFFDGKSGGNFCLFNKDNVITRLNLQLNTKTVSKKPHKYNDPSREDAFFCMKGAFVENVFMRTLVVFSTLV